MLSGALALSGVGCRHTTTGTGTGGSGGAITASVTGTGTSTGTTPTTGSTMTSGSTGMSSTSSLGFGGSGSTGTTMTSAPPLYVNTDTALYTFDLTTPQAPPVMVGAFDCIGAGGDSAMTDIAVNAAGDVWGVSAHHAYKLDLQGGGIVHCSAPINLMTPTGVRFYALTFAPAGTFDPNNEVLIAGNSAGELWEIDPNGTTTVHGNFGLVPANDGNGHAYAATNVGKAWELSGDIVFLAHGGDPIGFATVRDCPSPPDTTNCSFVDTLIQIDVKAIATATTNSVTQAVRGQVVPKASCPTGMSGFGSMYGIAAVGTEVYGFSRKGDVVAVDNTDGSACLIQTTPMEKWAGAGVTTLAMVVAPPPK